MRGGRARGEDGEAVGEGDSVSSGEMTRTTLFGTTLSRCTLGSGWKTLTRRSTSTAPTTIR
jgi:hypothetical protein